VRDVGSGANVRPQREAMLKAARRRELDIIVVWRIDRWGGRCSTSSAPCKRSMNSVSLAEALDLTTASGGHWPECWPSS
jgi:putative DNA-invertase from lambdoid prophage Rac